MAGRVQIVVRWMLSAILLVGVAAAGSAGAQATPDAEFNKIADAFSAAWAKGDAKGIAALHTKEAVRMSGNGEPAAVGTTAIENALTAALSGPFKGTTLTITPGKNYRVDADTYIGEGTYAVMGGSVPPGTPTRGQYMNTLVRQGGRWLIAASAVMPAMAQK